MAERRDPWKDALFEPFWRGELKNIRKLKRGGRGRKGIISAFLGDDAKDSTRLVTSGAADRALCPGAAARPSREDGGAACSNLSGTATHPRLPPS